MAQKYIAKCGRLQIKQSFDDLMRAAEDGTTGFCLACGSEQHGVEPDARKGTCEACDAPKVYGAEELVLMNLYHQ